MYTKKTTAPLVREDMPTDYCISLDAYTGRGGIGNGFARGEQRLTAAYGAKQSMRGFEESYQNIIDYIVRIMYRIWEEGNYEYIGATDYDLQSRSKRNSHD